MILVTINVLGSQNSYSNDTIIHPVTESDPHWKIVQKEINRITNNNPASPVGNSLRVVGRIEGKAIHTLFPNWDFYYLEYSGYKKEGFDNQPVSLVGIAGYTLAVSSDPPSTMYTYPFGDFLIKNKATIRNTADAKLVWDAFCEIHQHMWKDLKLERVSDNEWKLGIYSYDQTTSVVDGVETIVKITQYTKAATDPNTNRILSWESIVETTDKRLKPTQ